MSAVNKLHNPATSESDVGIQNTTGISASSSTESQLDLAGVDVEQLIQKLDDASKLKKWSIYTESNTDDSWQDLLPLVVSAVSSEVASNDILKPKVIEPLDRWKAGGMLSNSSQEVLKKWKDGTLKAVEQGNWINLINLTKRKKVRNIALGVPVRLKDAVINAWNQTYHGNCHEILLDDIDKLKTQQTYVNILPITQSSGTGKSKTVDRVSLNRILIPICLREDLGKNAFAYPLSDDSVRDYLLRAPSASEDACIGYINNLLSSLFQQMYEESLVLLSSNKPQSYKSIARKFHDFFDQLESRVNFYEDVVNKTTAGLNAKECFKQLEKRLKECCTEWPTTETFSVLISLDEVHILYDRRSWDKEEDHTLYSRFSSALSWLVDCDFAVISMSTAGHLPSLAPAAAVAPSLRERNEELFRPAPFTELPFDAHLIADPLVPYKYGLASVGSLAFTAKFGRPLFYATVLSRSQVKKISNLPQEIISVIKEKLSGHPWPPSEAGTGLNESTIAILSARLLLDLSPASIKAKPYEVELVRNHLRTLYSVFKDRLTLITGSSPEPLIAEASAQMMHHQVEGKNFINLWGLLLEFMHHGLADQGAVGELIGRTLSISAMDRAIDSLPAENICELKYQSPVTVLQYYQALLSEEAWQKLRTSIPANRAQLSAVSGKQTFEDAFKDAYFHFSHYGKANDASPIHDSCAWAYWLRGTAVLCQLNQELTDRMIPIYFSGRGNIGPETMSANLDQDKTGLSARPHNVSTQTAEDLSIFSKGQKLPYIAAVHIYAMDAEEDIRVFCPTRNCKHKEVDMEAPRYQIDFCGLNAYANITEADKATIRAMLNHTKNFLFDNHPRPSGVPAVRRMLPVLANDTDATRWFGGYDRKLECKPKGKKRARDSDKSDINSNVQKRAKKLQTSEPQKQVAMTLPPKRKRDESNFAGSSSVLGNLKVATRTSPRFRNQNIK